MAHNRGIKDPFSRKGGVPVSGADGRVPPRGSRGKNRHQWAACRGYRPCPLVT